MVKKLILFTTILVFESYSACSASNFVNRELNRLKDIHDYEFRHCTSPECRDKIDYLYKLDVKQLKNYPRIYIKYGSLLDEEVKKNAGPSSNVVRYCKKQYHRDPYMIEICIKNRTE